MSLKSKKHKDFIIVENTSSKWSLFIFQCDEIENYLEKLVDEGNNKIVLSLKGCDFIDSKGISILIHTSLRLHKTNGNLYLIDIPEHIKETLWHARSSGLSQWQELDSEEDLDLL